MDIHTEYTIPIHPLAPAKAPVGTVCNGCGVCCLFEPCPIGIFLTRKRSGACAAVRWEDSFGQYRCGAVVAPRVVLLQALPKGARWLAPVLTPLLKRMGLRWISAGSVCDSHLEVVRNAESTTIMASETMAANRAASLHHD
jgi:hypothetical protein